MRHFFPLVVLVAGLVAVVWPGSAATLEEALDTPGWSWVPSGDVPWLPQSERTHDGVDAAQAGVIGNGQFSQLATTVTGPGTLVFWAAVETGAGFTELDAGVDGGIALHLYEQSPAIGRGWRPYALDVPAGSHQVQFAWRCFTSAPEAAAQRAWLDQVSFGQYAGQPPVLIESPTDVAVGEQHPWRTSVTMTGGLPYTAILRRTGFTYTYPNQQRSHVELGVDQVYPNFAGPWQLILTNQFGAVTSQVFSLTVTSSPPIILTGPYSVVTGLGGPLELAATVRGTAPLHRQWQRDGADVPGQNADTLSLPVTTANDAGAYRLVVTNLYGAVTSQVAVVTLTTIPPTIVAPPMSQSVRPGDEAYFYVVCEGSPPFNYQWQRNGADLPGATGQELSIPAATPADNGDYRVIVRNAFGTVTSGSATLTVVDPIADALDAPGLKFELVNPDAPWSVDTNLTHDGVDAVRSDPVGADAAFGLRTTVMGPGTMGFWWRLDDSPGSQLLEFVVDGTAVATLASGGGWMHESLALGAGPHELTWTHRVADGAQPDGTGTAWLDEVAWVPAPPIPLAEALDAPELVFETDAAAPWSGQSWVTHDGADAARSGAIGRGQTSSIKVNVTGPGRLSYWRRLTAGDLDRLSFSLDGVVREVVTGPSDWLQVSFAVAAGNHVAEWTYQRGDTEPQGLDAAWLDEVSWAPYQLAEALDAPGLEFNVDESAPWFRETNVTHDGSDALQSTPPAVGVLSLLTVTLDGPGTLQFWGKVSAATDNLLGFYHDSGFRTLLVGESDWRLFTFEIKPGTQVVGWAFLRMTSDLAGMNAAFLDEVVFTPRTAPTISVGPVPARLLKGRAFELKVSAVGQPPLAYQWLKDGTNVPGATGTNYLRLTAGYGDTGNYAVLVTNSLGAVTSTVARVAVVPTFYRLQNLGSLGTGSTTSEAYDLNNHGEVVGVSDTDETKSYGNRIRHGFVWTPDHGLADLGDGRVALNVAPTNRLTGHSAALAINDQSDIVGYYEYRVNATQDGYGHAAYWRQSACALIPPVPAGARCPLELVDVHPASGVPVDTEAVDVNERRQILLQSGQTWVLEHRGYLLQPRDPADRFSPFTRHDLTPSVGWIDPNRLNNAGLVVGRYREFVGGEHPFLFDGIPTLSDAALTSGWPGPVLSAQFRAVNDRGVIAGLYATNSADGLRRRAFLQYPDGTVTQLEDPFVALSVLDGINNRGQLVGSEYANRAVLYTDGAWFLLNDLLTGPVGPNVLTAHAINDGGQIVGMAVIPLVGMRACLLTPDLPGNHSPVANPDALALPARGPALIPASALLANDSDSDGDRLQLEAVLGGGIGDATLAGGHVRRSGDAILYTPPLATVAGDAFEYVVNDGGGERATARVTVTLVPPDPAIPVLINPPQLTPDGGVLLSGQAPPGSVVTIYNMTAIDDALPLRAAVLEVDATGRWSIVLPATEGARRRFYSVDVQVPP